MIALSEQASYAGVGLIEPVKLSGHGDKNAATIARYRVSPSQKS